MKTYKFKPQKFGFQLSIPDGWHMPPIEFIAILLDSFRTVNDSPRRLSYERKFLGLNNKHLLISVRPFLPNEREPSMDEINQYIDELTHKQNLNIIQTGTIAIEHQEHFWVTYYRMSFIGQEAEFFKAYYINLNRVSYVLTAELYFASAGEKLPTDQVLKDNEKAYDEIVSSFKLLNM